jgi:uncharacterized OB-fold protein
MCLERSASAKLDAMDAASPTKPVPVPDDQTAGFWAAAADHVLAIQRCEVCGNAAHPPVMLCVNCQDQGRRFRFEPVSGRGRVKTWTVMRQAFLPGFAPDVPYAVAEIELDDADVRVIGRLRGLAPDALAVGAPVTVSFNDVADGVSVPVFEVTAS